jgi:hypothetical protein
MSKYLVLIYGDEQKWAEASQQWQDENVARHVAFNAANNSAVVGGGELARSMTAISVRADSTGRPKATAGPFVETEHNIGGFYLLEAPTPDEAMRIASQLPEASTPFSGIEIRAVADPA